MPDVFVGVFTDTKMMSAAACKYSHMLCWWWSVGDITMFVQGMAVVPLPAMICDRVAASASAKSLQETCPAELGDVYCAACSRSS
jgi:hypothetical protein